MRQVVHRAFCPRTVTVVDSSVMFKMRANLDSRGCRLFTGSLYFGSAWLFRRRRGLKLHEQILADNGRTWQVSTPFLPVVSKHRWQEMRRIIERRNAEQELWGFKDPRVCSFMMLWKHLLPDARVLLIYRHFSDSTYSLGQRHSTLLFRNEGYRHHHRRFWEEPDLALRMWLVHNEALLRFAHAYLEDTLAVSWDMVRGGFPVVKAIKERWGLGLDEVPASGVFDPVVAGRRPGKQPISGRRLIPRVEATWQVLQRLSEQTKRIMEEAPIAEG